MRPALLITQPDHAALSATIMRGWQSGGLPESPRHVAVMLAIQAHDNGWQEVDVEPCLDPATGRVLDFVHVPEDVRHAVWRRGVARLEGEPYAAALVAQHALHIYRRMRQQPGWRQFFVEMTAARDRHLLAAHETIETLQREYAFLRLADLASLTFCGVDTAGQAQEMGYDIHLEGEPPRRVARSVRRRHHPARDHGTRARSRLVCVAGSTPARRGSRRRAEPSRES